MTRFVFLDIDGVLNTPKTWGDWRWDETLKPPVQPELVELFKEWVLFHDISVVISSSWRSLVDRDKFVETLGGWLEDQMPRAWCTANGDKGHAISLWVDEHVGLEDEWVVLDDDDMGCPNHQMEIDYRVGLTVEGLSECNNLLGIHL